MREFLHVDDMAAASVFLMALADEIYAAHTRPMLSHINVGTGVDCSIRELAETLRVIGYRGQLVFDATKPDGTPRKLMDAGRLRALGWQPKISLEEGIGSAHALYLENAEQARN